MLHHSKPFTFYVTDAPQPKDIFWNNVGLTHKKQQIGFAIAQALTAVLCLFWTIPVTFVSSFSELDALKKTIPTLENAIANHPWLEPLLTQLNPMLIVILKMILPKILSKFCEREGHISRITLNASLLTKLAIFLVSYFNIPNGYTGNDSQVNSLLFLIVIGGANFFRTCYFWVYFCSATRDH